jgi:hypothetical protein
MMDFETGNPMIGNPNMDPYAVAFDNVEEKMNFETGNPMIGNPTMNPYSKPYNRFTYSYVRALDLKCQDLGLP